MLNDNLILLDRRQNKILWLFKEWLFNAICIETIFLSVKQIQFDKQTIIRYHITNNSQRGNKKHSYFIISNES